MISIVESVPRKLSGKTSLFVRFDYNEQIVNIIKTFSPAVFDRKNLTWEVSIIYLSKLLDTLTYIDDIQLTLLNTAEITEISRAPLTDDEINQLSFKPYQHQVAGINYGLEKKKWLLLDNPGCGKTNQIIGLAETLKRRKLIDHCLIIVGINSIKSNWAKEIKIFSKESSIIIGEKRKKDGTVSKTPMTIKERAEQLRNPLSEFFVIINVESLRDDNIVKAIMNGSNNFGMIAIDEVHKCLATGKSSIQGTNILKLQADFKVAATGTLILNNPVNCWGPLSWTENDHSTLTNFKSQYIIWGGFNNSQPVGVQNIDILKDELESCSLRRRKEDMVDLPSKTLTLELVDMDDTHRKFYEAVKNGVKEEVDKIELNANNLLAMTTRLRQATASPETLTTENIISSKVVRCVEMVEEFIESGEKVLVLSNFKAPVYQAARMLEKYKPLICTGDQSDIEVSNNVDKFQQDDEHYLMLGSHSKMGTGLTLNRATVLICIDTPWTWAAFDQSVCRIYRINNTKPIFVYVLANTDTIDERVWKIINEKREISDFVIDNIENSFSESLQAEMRDILLNL